MTEDGVLSQVHSEANVGHRKPDISAQAEAAYIYGPRH